MRVILSTWLLLLAILGTRLALAQDVQASAPEATRTPVEVLAIEYPPFAGVALPHNGQAFDVLNQALKNPNVDIVPIFVPPARVQYLLERGEWQATIVPPAGPLETAEQVFVKDAAMLFGLFRRYEASPFVWQNLNELAGKKVAVTRTTQVQRYNADFVRSGLELEYVENMTQAFQMLKLNRVHYVLTVEQTGWFVIDSLKLNRDEFQFSETLIDRFPYSVYINSKTAQGQALKKALGGPIKTHD